MKRRAGRPHDQGRVRVHWPGTKIVRTDGWVLCRCRECRMTNYVEPHGTTARCRKCRIWTEHDPIALEERDRMTRERFNPIRRKYTRRERP